MSRSTPPTRPPHDRRNDPKVCDFYLAAFDFEAGETVNWTIQALPEVPAKSGSVTLDAAGAGRSPLVDLPNGQYKLTWLTDRAHGAGKFKVFQVACPDSKATITPNGGAPHGWWWHRPCRGLHPGRGRRRSRPGRRRRSGLVPPPPPP